MKYHRLDTPGDNGTVNSEVVWSANSTYSTILYANRAAKVCSTSFQSILFISSFCTSTPSVSPLSCFAFNTVNHNFN